QFIQREQSRGRVAAAAAESGAVRNIFSQTNRHSAAHFRLLEKQFCGAHHEIVIAGWKIDIVTREIDPAILFLDVDLVVKRNRRDERLDLVKAIGAALENSE